MTKDQPTEADMTSTQFMAPELMKTVEMDRKRQDQPKVMRVQFREAEMIRVPVTLTVTILRSWRRPNKKQR